MPSKKSNAPKETIKVAINAKTDDLLKNTESPQGEFMTTNHGVLINDDQNSLKAGVRGPSLLEDFILREKITHFDHEEVAIIKNLIEKSSGMLLHSKNALLLMRVISNKEIMPRNQNTQFFFSNLRRCNDQDLLEN